MSQMGTGMSAAELRAVDLTLLSAEGRWTLREIMFRDVAGYTKGEIATELGLTTGEVARRWDALKAELEAQRDLPHHR